MRSVSVCSLPLTKEQAKSNVRKRYGSKRYTSNWLLSLTTRLFFACKKGPFPATKSLSLLTTPRATSQQLTVKATDEGNHFRFPKPVLLFKTVLMKTLRLTFSVTEC